MNKALILSFLTLVITNNSYSQEFAWKKIAPAPLAKRTGYVFGSSNSDFYVIGGRGDESLYQTGYDKFPYPQHFRDGSRFNFKTQSWTKLPLVPESARPEGAPGVWTGKELYFLGGIQKARGMKHGKTRYYNRAAKTGAAFNPLTNSWREISPISVDDENSSAEWLRYGHAGVFDSVSGSVLFFGGRIPVQNFRLYTNYSSIFKAWPLIIQPETNSWSKSASHIQLLTYGASRAWDPKSRRLYVHSGNCIDDCEPWYQEYRRQNKIDPDDTPFDRNAAYYDLGLNKWVDLPKSPGPLAPRYQASAVFADGNFIVWGGRHYTDRAQYASGMRFDINQNKWLEVSPSPLISRHDALALTDGHKMILVGGYHIEQKKDLGGHNDTFVHHCRSDGAVYSPQTDSWKKLPDLPAEFCLTDNNRLDGTVANGMLIVWNGTHGATIELK